MPAASAHAAGPATGRLAFDGPLPQRVGTPTFIQIEASECAAVILASLLQHYGRYITLEEARNAVHVSRAGTSAPALLKAARQFGFEAQGWKYELQDLPSIKLPFVIFWNFRHFMIVEGFERHAVRVNDPATGPRKIPIEEFDKFFTGVVLTFAPGPDFKTGGEQPNLIRSILRRFPADGKWALVFLVLTGVGLFFTGLFSPTFQRIFVDKFLTAGLDADWVIPMFWAMLLMVVIIASLQWLQRYVLVRFWIQLSILMEGRFLWHLLHLPLSFFSQRYAGDLAHRTVTNSKVATLLTGQLAETIISMLTLLPYGLLLLTYNWPLALIGIGIAVLNMVVLKTVARSRIDQNTTLLQQQGILNGTVMAGFHNIESVKATASEDDLYNRLVSSLANVVTTKQKLVTVSQMFKQAPLFLNQLNVVAMLVIGGYTIIIGDFTIGGLLAFQAFMTAFMKPFTVLTELGGQVQLAAGELYRLDDVLNTPAETSGDEESLAAPPAEDPNAGRIELRNVTFGYDPSGPPLLEDISLVIEPGRKVAIVGGSGSGKTTLISLVMGLLKPWSGEILFGGKPRAEWPRRELGRRLGYVSQNVFLFSGTIYDNLSLLDPSIPFERVEEAAKDACIHEAIAEKPRGYYSEVLGGGRNLSGGQCQRLEIARALAQEPTYLILDEATSALDTITEQRVDENLRAREITCLVAAHRLSTIRDAAEILVLQHGQVVERGTHEELLKQNGHYAELLQT